MLFINDTKWKGNNQFDHGRIALFVTLSIPLLLLSMCIALPEPEKFDCYGGNLTDGEKAMCDSAFEDAYEKKWGRKP